MVEFLHFFHMRSASCHLLLHLWLVLWSIYLLFFVFQLDLWRVFFAWPPLKGLQPPSWQDPRYQQQVKSYKSISDITCICKHDSWESKINIFLIRALALFLVSCIQVLNSWESEIMITSFDFQHLRISNSSMSKRTTHACFKY